MLAGSSATAAVQFSRQMLTESLTNDSYTVDKRLQYGTCNTYDKSRVPKGSARVSHNSRYERKVGRAVRSPYITKFFKHGQYSLARVQFSQYAAFLRCASCTTLSIAVRMLDTIDTERRRKPYGSVNLANDFRPSTCLVRHIKRSTFITCR